MWRLGRFPTLALPRSGSRVGRVLVSALSARLPELPVFAHRFLDGLCEQNWQRITSPMESFAIIRADVKVAYDKNKNYELALSTSERLHLLNPSNLRHLNELAHLQTKVGNCGGAVDSRAQFLERSPAGSNTEHAENAFRKLQSLTTRGDEETPE